MFNNDRFIAHTFLILKKLFNINTVIETGSFEGDTTVFLAKNFEKVFSIEMLKINHEITINKLNSSNLNANVILGKSEDLLKEVITKNHIDNSTIFFLDAHWWENCPLQQELEIIAECKIKPIIVIHDFYVPNSKSLGYDTYNNQTFCFDWIKPIIDKIYDYKYNYYYNDDLFSEGSKRGVIYIIPELYELQNM